MSAALRCRAGPKRHLTLPHSFMVQPTFSRAETSQRLLHLIAAEVLHFPRPKFKNPKIAVANVLGTDAEEGQSGSSSPRKTMLKSGPIPGMHISLQMATATFSSSNHKRLPLLIMCITIFIFLFKEGGLLFSPSFIFLNLFIGSHHMLRFPPPAFV